ncbi:hypothetical protein PMSD_23005 [Paenibacillus macquariensis subsp. defensor]|nr:hypothetical protein PMSD_23005 [Paenibacillus macquariensis subsp. defensor]
MAWLESHQGLARHIKTKRLSRKLSVTVPAVIGHLHLLWWWAMDNVPDGCLSLLEPEDIAEEMMWPGDANDLITALLEVGFIDEIGNKLFIHDWHDYLGKLIDKRKTDADRKRRSRKTSSGHPEDVPEDGAGNSTVPNSTVQYSTKDDIYNWLKLYKIECKGILQLEKAESYIGILDSPLIELFFKKSEGTSVAYFEKIAKKSISEGITTFAAWKVKYDKKQKGESRLDFLDEI